MAKIDKINPLRAHILLLILACFRENISPMMPKIKPGTDNVRIPIIPRITEAIPKLLSTVDLGKSSFFTILGRDKKVL